MLGKIFLHKFYRVSVDIHPPLGLLHIACYLFADWETHHSRAYQCCQSLVHGAFYLHFCYGHPGNEMEWCWHR
uniref:CESA5 n=1 Tax=Arundo donax TaxID=35708 RepID=A0A0A9ELJ9_ARUDO